MKIEKADVFRLGLLLAQIRDGLFRRGVRPRRVSPAELAGGVRGEIVEKLVSAIDEVELLAKNAGRRSRKGYGGMSPKVRYYQLMANLAQILDGVLRNVDLAKYEEKMEELEKTVAELQRTTTPTAG